MTWTTEYSALDRDDYKRCVCELVIADVNDVNCEQAAENVDPSPGPAPAPGPTPPSPLEELYELIKAIKDNPHHENGEISNTTW